MEGVNFDWFDELPNKKILLNILKYGAHRIPKLFKLKPFMGSLIDLKVMFNCKFYWSKSNHTFISVCYYTPLFSF